MARIGSLFVNLGLKDAAFISGLKRARQSTNSFSDKIKGLAKTAGVAAAAVGTAFVAASLALGKAVSQSINDLDNLAKSAQKAGVSVQELSKLRFAGSLSGISDDGLATALNRLNVALGDLGRKSTDATKALAEAGVVAGDTAEVALRKLADLFKSMPDGVAKSSLALEIFGRSGADLIPMLNGGSEALDAMGKRAESLGIVVSTKTAKAAELFNDNLNVLRTGLRGVMMRIAEGMLPTLSALTTEMSNNITVSDAWVELGKRLASGFLVVAEAISIVLLRIKQLGESIANLKKFAETVIRGDIGAAFIDLIDRSQEMGREIDALRASFQRIREEVQNFDGSELQSLPNLLRSSAEGANAFSSGLAAAAKNAEVLSQRVDELKREGPSDLFKPRKSEFDDSPLAKLTIGKQRTYFDDLIDRMDKVREFGEQFSQTLAQAVVYSGNIGQALINSIRAATAEALASELFKFLFGTKGSLSGGLFGDILSSVFGGFRAQGGRVDKGKAYVVGERQPELFVADTAGRIEPNIDKLRRRGVDGGSSRIINFNFYGPVTNPQEIRRSAAQAGAHLLRMSAAGKRGV